MPPLSRHANWLRSAFACTVVLTGQANAQTPPAAEVNRLALRWSAPDGCSNREEVMKDLRRLLGAAREPATPLDVDAKIGPIAGGFELVLSLRMGELQRVRQLRAPSCDELAHAAALVVASTIDPSLPVGTVATELSRESSADSLRPGPPALPQCEAAKPCPICARPEPAVAPPLCSAALRQEVGTELTPATTPTRGPVWLGAIDLAYGVLPQTLPRAALGAGYRTPSASIEASVLFSFASQGPRANGAGAVFAFGALAPRGCYEWGALGVCAFAEVGVVRASGFGVDAPRSNSSLWLAPGLSVRLSHAFASGTRLSLDLQGMLSTVTPRFHLDGSTVHQANRVIPAARLSCAAWL